MTDYLFRNSLLPDKRVLGTKDQSSSCKPSSILYVRQVFWQRRQRCSLRILRDHCILKFKDKIEQKNIFINTNIEKRGIQQLCWQKQTCYINRQENTDSTVSGVILSL